jgi:N-terminal region of glycosyl transferase group 7
MMLNKEASVHFLAIIIPFRNAFDELQQFVPYMSQFLANQSIPHEFFVINQVKI